jgi:hypothetical protein
LPARGKAKADRVSLRAFGRRTRVSLTAVQKAIRSGRLRKSIGRDARGPYVRDVALADREWAAGAAKPANGGGKGHTGGPALAPVVPGAGAPEVGTLVEAQLRVADQRAAALELANRRKRGELLDAATVERENFEVARILRERILNVPDRLADLDTAVRARIRDELRQALGAIADEIERE